MKGYENYFKKISDEDWEDFAVDVLARCGFVLIDGTAFGPDDGKDALVEKDDIVYLVSCKHNINSGKHVGTSVENNIMDRMVQHNAKGFIGFYSTGITNGLKDRLESYKSQGYHYIIFDKNTISDIMPLMEQRITFKYGSDKNKFYMNVNEFEYKPLPCMGCENDLLQDSWIPFAMAGITRNKENELEYYFACKNCLKGIKIECDVEISQVLNLDEINNWNSYIEDFVHDEIVSKAFWKNKALFDSRINQRVYPSNYGTWL